MLNPVGTTARWVAAIRALESERADRLFHDPYARALAGEQGFQMLEKSLGVLGPSTREPFLNSLAIRTRYIDEFILTAVRDGIDQLVILAAGMDARAFRMEFPPRFRLWELDQPDILALKQQILEPMRPKTRCSRHAVPVDLREDWTKNLLAANFDPDRPAIFIVEGLLIYLHEEQVKVLLERISKVAARGSRLACDLMGKSLLEFEPMKPSQEMMADLDAPFLFATDDPEALLEGAGWYPHCLCFGDEGANFGRWPFPSVPRSVPGIPRSFLCQAIR